MPIEPEKPDLNPSRAEPPTSRNTGPNPAAPGSAGENTDEKPVSALSPEEQMALFEKQLKEEDWGHQPC